MKDKLFNWLSRGINETQWKRFLELEQKVNEMDIALLHNDYPKCKIQDCNSGWAICSHGRAKFNS